MTLQQLKNKIAELEFWLKSNSNYPNYLLILKDKHALERQVEELETHKKP